MTAHPSLYDLIEKRRKELGLTQAEVSLRAFGRRDTSAIQGIRRGSSPTADRLAQICSALGLEFYVGKPRGFAEPAASWAGKKTVNEDGFLPLPWHDLARRAAAVPVRFSIEWLAEQGQVVDTLRMAIPDQPSFSARNGTSALVIVDTAASQSGHGALWCYKDGSSIMTGRFTWSKDHIAIDRNLPSHRIEIIPRNQYEKIRILGKIVWVCYFPNEEQQDLEEPCTS